MKSGDKIVIVSAAGHRYVETRCMFFAAKEVRALT
jgi:phosphoserine phosphatase